MILGNENGDMGDPFGGALGEGRGPLAKAKQQSVWPEGPNTGAHVKHRVHGGKGVVKLTGAVVEWSDGTFGVHPIDDLTQE